MRTKLYGVGFALLLTTIWGSAALAQAANPVSPLAAPSVAELARPIGVSIVPPPPANFDPLTASTQELARYAIPPAPDARRSPRAYKSWRDAVLVRSGRGALNATINQAPTAVQLTPTSIYNRPMQPALRAPAPATAATTANSTATVFSSNWSGASVINFKNPLNQESILTEFTVPNARQALNTCSGQWDFSSFWPGIDGNGSSDVLQAGIEADAYCSGGNTQSYYSAWIEWYPNAETRVSVPSISPGDLIYVQVWNATPTTGYAYIANLSTQQASGYYLTAPSGTSLVGNSVEWIVERPGVNNSTATLTNYVGSSWTYGFAWDYTATPVTYYLPGVSAGDASTLQSIIMQDNSGKNINSANVETSTFLYFQDYGSACSVSNVSPPC